MRRFIVGGTLAVTLNKNHHALKYVAIIEKSLQDS